MKLRLHGNAIRLRLSQADVALLARHGRIEEAAIFPNGAALRWLLEAAAVPAPEARLNGAEIRILLPAGETTAWLASTTVGLYSAPGAPGPAISVEKDFQCLHDPLTGARDDADSFPNPAAKKHQPA